MAKLASPTSYTTNVWQNGQSPPYEFPSTFRIGNKQTPAPLVTPEQVKGHLGLLRLFWGLRQTIEAGEDDRLPTWSIQIEPERRWAWFVTLAVERFERWCNAVKYVPLSRFVDRSLPPLDVIMIWHTYLLNPGWYTEDTTRNHNLRSLCLLNEIFAVSLPNIDGLLSMEPSKRRSENWSRMTSTPFDPLESAAVLERKSLQCPKCRQSVTAPFHSALGNGYAQQNFKITCRCSFDIDKDKLGAFKLVRNLVKVDNGAELDAHLAGTLYTPTNKIDITRARLIKQNILKSEAFAKGNYEFQSDDEASQQRWEDHILTRIQYSLNGLKKYIGIQIEDCGEKLLNRIMTAYGNDHQSFSVDLVGAVLRQGLFIQKMHQLGWIDPSFYDSKAGKEAVEHSVMRYHAFLDLVTLSPMSFFVPTMDIDLVWHTHQLRAKQYMQDCDAYVGRYVDHDDKVEEDYLSTAFDATCRAWKSRFHIPYMYCGCPLPGDTVKQKILSKLKCNSQPQQSSLGSFAGDPGFFQATHPSDHDAVFAFHLQNQSETSRRKRRSKAVKRRQRDAEKIRRGKLDGDVYQRGEGHDQAFLKPIPAYYIYGYGGCTAFHSGVYGGNAGACAAGAGGCAVGGSICGSGGK